MRINVLNSAIAVLFFLLLQFQACIQPGSDRLAAEVDSVAGSWVPDAREGICTARIDTTNGKIVLYGETNHPGAKTSIIKLLSDRNISFIDSMLVLPDTLQIPKSWGVVTLSVCNIRLKPSQAAEMVSQAILGTPVRILKEQRGWILIQTPDSYLGWTEGESVMAFSWDEFLEWKSSARLIYLEKSGDIFTNSAQTGIVSDIVAGCIVKLSGEKGQVYEIKLPDGRKGFIPKKSCMDFSSWAESAKPEAEKLIETGFSLMGSPYLWGGTSIKGMDCSGFTKTVYFLNGMILARDVSLQYKHVRHISPSGFPDSLNTGDLLFFGSVRDGKPRPTHVGIYIGDTEFIHSSGMVRINSLDSTRVNFSRYRKNSFLGAGRILGLNPGRGIQLVSNHNWYN